MNRIKNIVGKKTVLTELEPKFFEYVVKWRNDSELNKYINQPFVLTLELEKNWYEQKYLNDPTQMMYVMLDKETEKPFATMGYTDYDADEKICISARLMAGEREYQGSVCLIEGLFLFFDCVYNRLNVDTIYSHVVRENLMSLRLQKRFGLFENTSAPRFPECLKASKFSMVEIVGTRETFESARNKIEKFLNELC